MGKSADLGRTEKGHGGRHRAELVFLHVQGSEQGHIISSATGTVSRSLDAGRECQCFWHASQEPIVAVVDAAWADCANQLPARSFDILATQGRPFSFRESYVFGAAAWHPHAQCLAIGLIVRRTRSTRGHILVLEWPAGTTRSTQNSWPSPQSLLPIIAMAMSVRYHLAIRSAKHL